MANAAAPSLVDGGLMTKVYIVTDWWAQEGEEILGVYSTHAKADEAARTHEPDYDTANPNRSHGVAVTEYEVDPQ